MDKIYPMGDFLIINPHKREGSESIWCNVFFVSLKKGFKDCSISISEKLLNVGPDHFSIDDTTFNAITSDLAIEII